MTCSLEDCKKAVNADTGRVEVRAFQVTSSQRAGLKVGYYPGPFPATLGKGPGQNWEKMTDLTSKLGEINDIEDIEHNKGSKIYPQNQVILECIMSSIPLKHKYLSIILKWVIVSHN